jgi:hypothetical protein
MVCGRTGALMTATLVTGGVDGGAYRGPPPKFTYTDTRLNNGLRLIVAAAPKGYLGGAEGQTRSQAALRVHGCRIAQSEYVCADCLQTSSHECGSSTAWRPLDLVSIRTFVLPVHYPRAHSVQHQPDVGQPPRRYGRGTSTRETIAR